MLGSAIWVLHRSSMWLDTMWLVWKDDATRYDTRFLILENKLSCFSNYNFFSLSSKWASINQFDRVLRVDMIQYDIKLSYRIVWYCIVSSHISTSIWYLDIADIFTFVWPSCKYQKIIFFANFISCKKSFDKNLVRMYFLFRPVLINLFHFCFIISNLVTERLSLVTEKYFIPVLLKRCIPQGDL